MKKAYVKSPQNKKRASRARLALKVFTDNNDLQTDLGDLLCDFLHLCAQRKIDFIGCLNMAYFHFNEEKAGVE